MRPGRLRRDVAAEAEADRRMIPLASVRPGRESLRLTHCEDFAYFFLEANPRTGPHYHLKGVETNVHKPGRSRSRLEG
jgi:hypothetical protein